MENRASGSIAVVVAGLTLAAACDSGLSGRSTPTHRISGTVKASPDSGLADVSLALQPDASTTTNADGDYTFTDIADGTYAMTPSKAGYSFEPASCVVVVHGADVRGVGFGAGALASPPESLSGTITQSAGPLPGVTVYVSGTNAYSAVTAADGKYSITPVVSDVYSILPVKPGYSFAPWMIRGNFPQVSIADFSATPATYKVRGTVTITYLNGDGGGRTPYAGGLAKATNGANSGITYSASTDANGYYEIPGVPNGQYDLRNPTGLTYCFGGCGPRSITVNGADVVADFSVVY